MTRSLFVTPLYEAEHRRSGLLDELAHSIRTLAEDDEAGRRWSKDIATPATPAMPRSTTCRKRDPAFADLAKLLTRHAAAFAARASTWGASRGSTACGSIC